MAFDFSLSPEHQMVRDTVRSVCKDELLPLVAEAEEHERFPRHIFRRWGELSLLGVRYPEADGGTGLDKVGDCIVREELSYVSQAFATSWSAHSHLGIWPIWKIGTPSQRERFFAPALTGEKVASFAVSEPDGGSSVRALKTKAHRVAGGWKLHHQRANCGFPHAGSAYGSGANSGGHQLVHSRIAVERHGNSQTAQGRHPRVGDRADPS
jgi:butyryl-CoA dehydrogenase